MKTLLCILMTLTAISPAMAAKNGLKHNPRAQARQQLHKELTGHCYYNEAVRKTNIGWKSNEEISRMSPRQKAFIKFKNNEVNTRKVYVSKNLCSGDGKMASRSARM